jgi:DNA polymerase
MGPVASQIVLARDESLIRLRGTFHHYTLTDGTRIPVMPTFHPTYLLKNPEMKKPTWSDLQAVRKQLDSVQ